MVSLICDKEFLTLYALGVAARVEELEGPRASSISEQIGHYIKTHGILIFSSWKDAGSEFVYEEQH